MFAEVLAGAAWLIDNRRTMMVNDREQPVPVREALAGFANYVPDHSMSFANFLRVQAGGTVPRPRTRGPLIRALQVNGFRLVPRDVAARA